MTEKLQEIGRIQSPFSRKFGTPRQPGLIPNARGSVLLPKTTFNLDAVRGLDGYSHIWIIFGFHQVDTVTPLIKPPLLPKGRVGVFATRSPHRPNHLGLSAVQLLNVEQNHQEIILRIAGGDMVDGTPVYDIKPYLQFTDAIPDTRHGWRDQLSEETPVQITFATHLQIDQEQHQLIHDVLMLDPRPKTQRHIDKEFELELAGLQVFFTGHLRQLTVTRVHHATLKNRS